MADLSPIMTLFREFEAKYRQAGDMTFDEEIATGLLDECGSLEKRIMASPSTSAQDFAAKLIVQTRYGDFLLDDRGEGGLIDEAEAILAGQEHPDAKLIELGRQFERAKAEALLLERELQKLQPVLDAAKKDAGIHPDQFDVFTPEIEKASRKLSRQIGCEPVYQAFLAKHGESIKLMNAIHRSKATTLEGFAVKIAAVAFDQSDFEVSDPVPTDVAERMLYRVARQMTKAAQISARAGR